MWYDMDTMTKQLISERHERSGSAQSAGATASRPLDTLRCSLIAEMSPPVETIERLPNGLVEQARRNAVLRTELMGTGAFSIDDFAEVWNVDTATARKRVDRARTNGTIFSVSYEGRTFVPAFLLQADGTFRSDLTKIITLFREAGEEGFALWLLLTEPSPWLDGGVLEEVAQSDPEPALRAARARVEAVAI